MNKNTNDNLLIRDEFLRILQAAVEAGSTRFLKEAATHWLAVFPGDLAVRLQLANAMSMEGRTGDSEEEIKKILDIDPMYLEAYKLLDTFPTLTILTKSNLSSILYALGASGQQDDAILPWAISLNEIRTLVNGKNFDPALEDLQEILASEEYPILIAIEHMIIVRANQNDTAVLHLAQIYRNRWPDCVHFKLHLADALMKLQQETDGMELLHECANMDSAGQVAGTIWGAEHPYREMWPANLEVAFDLPIPADVATALGSNKLVGGIVNQEVEHGLDNDIHMPIDAPEEETLMEEIVESSEESLEDILDASGSQRMDVPPNIQEGSGKEKKNNVKILSRENDELPDQGNKCEQERMIIAKLAKKLGTSELTESNTRFPAYIILSSHSNLEKTYGEKTAEVIESQMNRLAETIKKRPGWNALVLLPDDQTCMDKFNLKAVDTVDPWNVKLAIADLDKALTKKGEMIGALLIVGGDEIVPFHRLPNPTNDADSEVLSDNPYATPEANYFIPLWMTGRFPSETAQDAGLLLSQIRKSIRYHELQSKKHPQWALFWRYMNSIANGNGVILDKVKYRNIAYTAAVWRRSSLASFRPVGEGRDMFVSPPESTTSINRQKLVGSPLGYYNLHGLADSPEWYGQRDPNEKKQMPDFPVALTPADLGSENSIPKLVFSAACYGAYTVNKSEDESIALKFVSRGAISFIGSTCVSYGSITTPLISADLLGNLIWKFIKEGYSTGESLMKAKIELVREMNKRQGFLDGEDQKTLISFVLYGDPLVCKQISPKRKKALIRTNQPAVIKIVCDAEDEGTELRDSAGEAIAQAKELLADYLPGLSNAELSMFTNEQSKTDMARSFGKVDMGKTVQPARTMNRNIVVFSKQMTMNNHNTVQYARLTIDNAGKLVKMSVSR